MLTVKQQSKRHPWYICYRYYYSAMLYFSLSGNFFANIDSDWTCGVWWRITYILSKFSYTQLTSKTLSHKSYLHRVSCMCQYTNPLLMKCYAGIIIYYNMTVWHFGPCVTFWTCLCDISARLVWHFGPLVRNEGKRVSPYPHINHRRR